MKNFLIIILALLLVFSNCMNKDEKISITDSISVTLPDGFNLINRGTGKHLIEAAYNGDMITVFKASYNLPDTVSDYLKKQYFVNNVNGFTRPFDFKNLDSTFVYQTGLMQCDLRFDYVNQDKNNTLFGRLIVKNNDFIAICYHTKDPAEKSSVEAKNRLFASVMIK